MPKKFDCNEYGDISYGEIVSYCLDCEKDALQQQAYYKGDKDDKVLFCTECGKTYTAK